MARSSTTNLLLTVGIGYFFYSQAKSGAFGPDAKKFVDDLTSGGSGGGGGGNTTPPSSGDAALWSKMMADNPNIAVQIDAWKIARAQAGEDRTDWNAFRAHLARLQAPDPGPVAPSYFTQPNVG